MPNVKFNYLYRDAGNYKKSSSVVFSNPQELSPESVEETLRQFFLEKCLFIAGQVRVPDCFLFTKGAATSDDHCFHELAGIDLTQTAPNDIHRRSIVQFIGEIKRESKRGWRAFDPHELPARATLLFSEYPIGEGRSRTN